MGAFDGMATWKFIGRCDELEENDLRDFDDSSREITGKTVRRHLGKEAWRELESWLGYLDSDGKPYVKTLRLTSDWAVRFEKGKWKGAPALNVFWSHYHHIFLRVV